MEINFLEGYKNSFNGENNSITLRMNTNSFLKQHLNRIRKNRHFI